MKRWTALAAAAALVWGTWATGAAHAQPGGPIGGYNRPQINPHPTVSPYLNLNRFGATPGQNFYNLVRPQQQTNQSLNQLQQEIGSTGATTGMATTPDTVLNGPTVGPTTGHPVAFGSYGRYFPSTIGGFGGAGGGGTGIGGVGGGLFGAGGTTGGIRGLNIPGGVR